MLNYFINRVLHVNINFTKERRILQLYTYMRNSETVETQSSFSILAEPLIICMLKAEHVGVVMAKNSNQQSH